MDTNKEVKRGRGRPKKEVADYYYHRRTSYVMMFPRLTEFNKCKATLDDTIEYELEKVANIIIYIVKQKRKRIHCGTFTNHQMKEIEKLLKEKNISFTHRSYLLIDVSHIPPHPNMVTKMRMSAKKMKMHSDHEIAIKQRKSKVK